MRRALRAIKELKNKVGFEDWLTKTEKTSLLLFIAPTSLMLVSCVPANVSKLTFAVPPNHQPPFRLKTTTRTINKKNNFLRLVLDNDSHDVVLNIVGNITQPCK